MPTIDDESAVRLLVAIFAQAARDALAGDDAAARWLRLNEVPSSSWYRVAKIQAQPMKPYKPHRQAA